MWPSPSITPTKTSFISSGIVIKALSAEDKHVIPSVERNGQHKKLNQSRLKE